MYNFISIFFIGSFQLYITEIWLCLVSAACDQWLWNDDGHAAVRVTFHVDCSVDMQSKNSKSVIIWYSLKECPGKIWYAFIGMVQPEVSRTRCTWSCDKNLWVVWHVIWMLGGITTVGGTANTGRARRPSNFSRIIITVFCLCHWSDLAIELSLEVVPDLKLIEHC